MPAQSRLLPRFFRALVILLLVPLGTYLAAALILGHLPANAAWHEPDRGITIFVQTNGVHTGIVLPAGPHRWRAYGWGDRRFYIDTPTWREARLGTIMTALTGGGPTVVHVDRLGDFVADENWRPLRLRPAEYRRLAAFIGATFAAHPAVAPGYTPDDSFYAARGRYSAVNTCNVWTGNALRAAGVRMGWWTPFASDVMRWVPAP